MKLVIDSGGLSFLAEQSEEAAGLLKDSQQRGMWPPIVPSPVLIECLQGHAGRDARVNLLLKSCDVVEVIDTGLARRAGWLRTRAQKGSAVDALVVAVAEPGGVVLTSDPDDLRALAAYARDVRIVAV